MDSDSILGFVMIFIYLSLLVAMVASFWKVFAKAGRRGWESIIPFYSLYVLLKIAGRPGWWLLLYIIPFVNIIISLIVAIDLARAFGKGTGFGVVALWLFSFVGFLILGFGKSKYIGISSTQTSPPETSTAQQSSPEPPLVVPNPQNK